MAEKIRDVKVVNTIGDDLVAVCVYQQLTNGQQPVGIQGVLSGPSGFTVFRQELA